MGTRAAAFGLNRKISLSIGRAPAPQKLWMGIFALWAVFLSGLLGGLGSPGVIQAIRLEQLLAAKKGQILQLQTDIKRLQGEAAVLEKSKETQHREIRRVLGYAAPDEIVFDFSSGDAL